MASPPSRRPGFSRRAQYGLFLSYVAALGGVLFAALMLVVARVDPAGFQALKGVALDVTRPVGAAGHGVSAFFTGLFDSIGNYLGAGGQNAELKRRIAAERRALIQAKATELDNRRLKAMLKLSEEVPDPVAVTTIVGSSFDSVRRLATLAAGAPPGL